MTSGKSNKVPKKTMKAGYRESIIKLANDLLVTYKGGRSLLVNVFGIGGMGKTTFLEAVFSPRLEQSGIIRKSLRVRPGQDVAESAVDVFNWIAQNVLTKGSNLEKIEFNHDLEKLEDSYRMLHRGIVQDTNKTGFALLIDDLDNLPFDDLDWFQSVVIETINMLPKAIIVITSHNELNWHSWELRNDCTGIRLPGFDLSEVDDVCSIPDVAQDLLEISAGHPATVRAFVQQIEKSSSPLVVSNRSQVQNIQNEWLTILREQIEINLSERTDFDWLKDVFWFAAALEWFDAELINDVVKEFPDEISVIPEDVTDIAWEMSYTGLALWDSEEKGYKIVPELRGRIVAYMERVHLSKYVHVLEVAALSFLNRAENASSRDDQLINYLYYLAKSYLAQNGTLDFNTIGPKILLQIVPYLNEREYQEEFIEILREKSSSLLPELKIIADYLEHQSTLTELGSTAPIEDDELVAEKKMEDAMPDVKSGPVGKSKNLYLLRTIEQNLFKSLIHGQLEHVAVLSFKGEPGVGKSVLLRQFRELAIEEGFHVVLIDLHHRRNRRRSVFLAELVKQLGIGDAEIELGIEKIFDPQKFFSAVNEAEAFENASRELVPLIIERMGRLANQDKKRIILLIDTFDTDASISYLASWLFPKFVAHIIEGSAYVVVAGRRSLTEDRTPGINAIQRERIKSSSVKKFENQEIEQLIPPKLESSLGPDLKEKIVELADGNPLIARWLIFFVNEDGAAEKIIEWKTRDVALSNIAWRTWRSNAKPVVKGFLAAVHFGPDFTPEIFERVVSSSELVQGKNSKTHDEVLSYLRTHFEVYGRSSTEIWTLHDEVRDQMFVGLSRSSENQEVFKDKESIIEDLKRLSSRAIEYYDQEIEKKNTRKNKTGLSPDDQAELDDFEAERFYHKLFIESKAHHVDLWNYLDRLWHGFKLEEMSQVIQYARDAQKRNASAQADNILTNLLNAADAWLHHSRGDYEKAEELAIKVKNNNAPRRLYATALVVLGSLPRVEPPVAEAYLSEAEQQYNSLLTDLHNKKELSEDFFDSYIDVLQEQHLVLINKGRLHVNHFFDLQDAEESLETAYKMANSKEWNRPLYRAVALNEQARIKRFKGELDAAFKKVIQAINIYENYYSTRKEDPRTDLYFPRFFITLGLIYKEKLKFEEAVDAFNKALHMYENIHGLSSAYSGAVFIEIGHVFVRTGQYDKAKEYLNNALSIFESRKEDNRWSYLSTLNKLGELYLNVDTQKAKEYFLREKEFAENWRYDLWAYWATYYLAEIDFKETESVNKQMLTELLNEYRQNRERDLGPAFWSTKLLLSKVCEHEGNLPEMFNHLVEGLSYLLPSWKPIFLNRLDLLSANLLIIDNWETRVAYAQSAKRLWKKLFPEIDPAPEFNQLCDEIIGANRA
jgi:tetratricopeptide (TPR) repeat protein